MFFTSRKTRSLIYPEVTADLQQVVYGHAELGQYVPRSELEGGGYRFEFDSAQRFPEDLTTFYPTPAHRWHLARRSVLLLPTEAPAGTTPPWARWLDQGAVLTPPLTDMQSVLRGSVDVVGGFSYQNSVLTSGGNINSPCIFPWYWPLIFDRTFTNPDNPNPRPKPFARSELDPDPPPALAGRLGAYCLPNCASFKVEWALDPRSEFVGDRLSSETQVYWFDPGAPDDPLTPNYDANPLDSLEKARAEADATAAAAEEAGMTDQVAQERESKLGSLLFSNLGRLDPAGPPNSLYTLSERFRGQPYNPNVPWLEHGYGDNRRANLAVFTATRGVPPLTVEEDVFPGALRITIDLYDALGRLERPIRHVMVFTVGS